MKRVICLIIVAASLFLVACGKKPTPKTENKTELYSSSMMHAAVELSSRVILAQNGGLWYYSKVDGESYRFCFNPLCQHKFADKCPSALFWHTHSLTSQLVYCEENNRVYVARGQKIYSMSFDASDLRLECSLGENGDISESFYDMTFIRNLRCYKKYVYFIYNNDTTGNLQVVRLDTVSKKTEEMTSAETEHIMAYEIANGYIYFKSVSIDNAIGYYISDFDFKNRKKVDDPINPTSLGMTMEVYDGKYFYGKNDKGLYAFNPISSEKIFISSDKRIVPDGMITAVHEGYAFFMPYNPDGDRAIYSSVYRVSQNGIIDEVLDFPECYILSLNFVSDGVIINFFSIDFKVDENEKQIQKSNGFIHFEIADDGKFVNPRPIGNFADDTELIEYLKGKS